MKPAEEAIIKIIQEFKHSTDPKAAKLAIKGVLEELIRGQDTFGSQSAEFINHPDLFTFISNNFRGSTQDFFILWLRIEEYFRALKVDLVSAQKKLGQVEAALEKCLEYVTVEAKERGMAMLPHELANAQFMRRLYSTNDKNISNIFLKYLPAPRAEIFAGQDVPAIIAERERSSTQAIKNVLARKTNDLASVESKLIKVQRKYRAKKRAQENVERLPYRYFQLQQGPDLPRGLTTKGAQKLLHDANTPYMPKCDKALAERIMAAANNVKLFSTVSHLTAATALESIFNDGLLGRRNILQFYMLFKPAALWASDIAEGDANVVCLGANAIDPKARHGIELVFDAKKIAANNPCVFYKQRDLGYYPDKVRSIKIGDLDVHFSHTVKYSGLPAEGSSLILFSSASDREPYAVSQVIKALLIADNLPEMHRILTLNFFRFIDDLLKPDFSKDFHNRDRIYSALSKLDDQQLAQALLDIGKNMTDSMEFNFYGAYKIDFSALKSIKNEDSGDVLILAAFVKALKTGEQAILENAMKKFPEIFKSYRFIDFLLSVTAHVKVVATLQEQRKKCTLPAWIAESTEESKSDSKIIPKPPSLRA